MSLLHEDNLHPNRTNVPKPQGSPPWRGRPTISRSLRRILIQMNRKDPLREGEDVLLVLNQEEDQMDDQLNYPLGLNLSQ